jgi:hypothetical protein
MCGPVTRPIVVFVAVAVVLIVMAATPASATPIATVRTQWLAFDVALNDKSGDMSQQCLGEEIAATPFAQFTRPRQIPRRDWQHLVASMLYMVSSAQHCQRAFVPPLDLTTFNNELQAKIADMQRATAELSQISERTKKLL